MAANGSALLQAARNLEPTLQTFRLNSVMELRLTQMRGPRSIILPFFRLSQAQVPRIQPQPTSPAGNRTPKFDLVKRHHKFAWKLSRRRKPTCVS
jgi:hypothetical protein